MSLVLNSRSRSALVLLLLMNQRNVAIFLVSPQKGGCRSEHQKKPPSNGGFLVTAPCGNTCPAFT